MRKNKNKLVAVIMAFGMTIVPITQVNAMEIGNIDEIVESKTDTSDFGDDYEESSSFEIRNELDLRKFAKMVNSGKDFAGKKVVIPKEIGKIELSGEWTPIGKARIDIHNGKNYSESERSFKGEFDGNGCEISGLRLKNIYADSNTLGLFGTIRNAKVGNLVFTDVNIDIKDLAQSDQNLQTSTGTAVGVSLGESDVHDVTVKSGNISIGSGAAVVGMAVNSGNIYNNKNEVDVNTNQNEAILGGIVGKAYYIDSNIDINNNINNANIGSYGAIKENEKASVTGGIVGFSSANVFENENVSPENVKESNSVISGGIVGIQTTYGDVFFNKNSTTVIADRFAGGIIGLISYNNHGDERKIGKISVKENKNSADVISNHDRGIVGGIVGQIYNTADVSINTNTASKISGGVKGYSAGIVGNMIFGDNYLFSNDDELNIYVHENISTTDISNLIGNKNRINLYANGENIERHFISENNSNEIKLVQNEDQDKKSNDMEIDEDKFEEVTKEENKIDKDKEIEKDKEVKDEKVNFESQKIIGKDRYDTAAKVATSLGKYNKAILVNAENSMSDGLSAAGLSGKEKAPILLVKRDSIPQSTLEKLKNVDKVYIIGGNNAISENVETELKSLKNIKSIERLAGKDRVETSKAVAREIKEYSKAFVVNGYKGEADAMSASPLAAKYKAPIILTNGKNIEVDKKDVEYYVIGGEAVVDNSIVKELSATRISGKDRYETNRKVIARFYKNKSKLYIANGRTLVDALTSSNLAKEDGIVLVSENTDNSILNGKNIIQIGGMNFKIKK